MEYDKKSLKIAAKIAASSLSESGSLDQKSAENTVSFLKTVCEEITRIKESENFEKCAFKAAGKITAAAFEETEEQNGKKAAAFFKTVYQGIVPMASAEGFDEDIFKYAGKITAAACQETEDPTEEKAARAAEFFRAVYNGILKEEPACIGKYAVKRTQAGFSFCLLAGNGQVIGVSEVYSARSALEKGVESVRKNAPKAPAEDRTVENFEEYPNPKFEIFKDKAGEFRFRLKAKNGEVILASEGYKTKASCENGIESVRKNSAGKIEE